MLRRPPASTRTYTLVPYTTLCRSLAPRRRADVVDAAAAGVLRGCGGAVRPGAVRRNDRHPAAAGHDGGGNRSGREPGAAVEAQPAAGAAADLGHGDRPFREIGRAHV